MHIDLNGVGGLAALVGALLVALAAAFAILRSTYAKTSIEALRGDRDDLLARVDRLEAELKEANQKHEDSEAAREADKKSFEEKLADETAKRTVLEGVVTGKAQMDKMTELLERIVLGESRTGKVVDAMAKEMGLSVP